MNASNSAARLCVLCTVLWMVVSLSGCRRSVDESNDRSLLDAVGANALESSVEEIVVPDGTPDELLQFMDDVQLEELRGFDVASQELTDEYVLALNRVMQARVTACDKILAQDEGSQVNVLASRLKLQGLQTLAMLNGENDVAAYDTFVSELKATGNDDLERLVVISQFEKQLSEFISTDDADETVFLDQLDTFLDRPNAGKEEFEMTRHTAGVVFQSGNVALSADILHRLGDRFRDHEDASIAEQAKAMVGEAIQLRITQQVDATLTGKPQAISTLLETVELGLANAATRDDVMGYALQAALALEARGEFDSANQVYRAVQDGYENTDSELSESLDHSVGLAQRRMELIGQSVEIEGVLLDGQPFDWESYRGNYVLVCFWQSWHSGWVDEVRKLRQTVSPFRDQGVKIVTVNLDDDRNGLERYLQETPLSLPIVVNADATAAGFENPNAVRCGVEAVPFTLLVDPNGVVVDIHSRGERLHDLLEQKLNPSDSPRQASNDGTLLRYVALMSPAEDVDEDADQVPAVDDSVTTGRAEIDLELALEQTNPYAPPADATPLELVEFILEMEDKPRSIQRRNGFAAGIVEASDRLISSDAKDKWKTIALLSKTKYLHRDASLGNAKSEQALQDTIRRWQADSREEIVAEMRFLRLEQSVLDADDLATEDLPPLLDELSEFYQSQSLSERHLRIASLTVHAVNRLPADQREPYFQKFGEQFAKSDDKALAGYGRRIAKSSSVESPHLNQVLALAGITAAGVPFDWESYRGNWVVVDFWATWCGPCRRAMPSLRKLANEFQPQGLRIVGVNLDEDLQAVAEFLADEPLPWTNLVGQEAGDVAKKLGVREIPSLMLVDGEGRIQFISHKVAEIAKRVEQELEVGS